MMMAAPTVIDVSGTSPNVRKPSRIDQSRATKTLVELPAEHDGKNGIWEWIILDNGDISHQRFIAGGLITGRPNQRVAR